MYKYPKWIHTSTIRTFCWDTRRNLCYLTQRLMFNIYAWPLCLCPNLPFWVYNPKVMRSMEQFIYLQRQSQSWGQHAYLPCECGQIVSTNHLNLPSGLVILKEWWKKWLLFSFAWCLCAFVWPLLLPKSQLILRSSKKKSWQMMWHAKVG